MLKGYEVLFVCLGKNKNILLASGEGDEGICINITGIGNEMYEIEIVGEKDLAVGFYIGTGYTSDGESDYELRPKKVSGARAENILTYYASRERMNG